jgi:hypothetical protein
MSLQRAAPKVLPTPPAPTTAIFMIALRGEASVLLPAAASYVVDGCTMHRYEPPRMARGVSGSAQAAIEGGAASGSTRSGPVSKLRPAVHTSG